MGIYQGFFFKEQRQYYIHMTDVWNLERVLGHKSSSVTQQKLNVEIRVDSMICFAEEEQNISRILQSIQFLVNILQTEFNHTWQ